MHQEKTKSQLIKILVAGNSNVGKSSLIKKFCTGHYSGNPIASTLGKILHFFPPDLTFPLGTDFHNKTLKVNGKEVGLEIWDIQGQEKYSHSVPDSYFRRANAIMLVYSQYDRDSFECIQTWMEKIEEKAPKNVTRVLVAAKCDEKPEDREIEVSTEEAVNLAKSYQMEFFETSAKEGIQVDAPFRVVAQDYLDQEKALEMTNDTLNILAAELQDGWQRQSLRSESDCCFVVYNRICSG